MSNVASELPPLSDRLLSEQIVKAGAAGDQLLVIANGYTAALAARNSAAHSWSLLGRDDFGLVCGSAAEDVAQAGRLWWAAVSNRPAAVDLDNVSAAHITPAEVQTWLKAADALTTQVGRGKSPRADDMDELGYLAAWRCQFSGCGKDLRRHAATGAPNRSSYFAHIIASSPNGPRGDALLSDRLSADITNFLLLCDDCHRRMDRQDPDRFTVDVLRRMREQSITEVRRLLSALQYPEAQPVVVMGNVATQSPHFELREAEEAMWTRKLRLAPGQSPLAFFENGWNQHDPHSAGYWASLFHGVEGELPQLKKLLRSPPAGASTTPLAVFPLHGTSVLVLARRVFGEAAAATVFQFRRERPREALGGRWGYDADARPRSPTKYSLETLRSPITGDQEAALIVALTFDLDGERLGEAVFKNGQWGMPALRLSADGTLSPDVLDSPGDLDEVSRLLGEAVRTLQDDWKVSTVHLFVAAPTSVAFKVGQKLQARHHATFRCYESERGPQATYKPTLDLRSTEAVVPGTPLRLQLG